MGTTDVEPDEATRVEPRGTPALSGDDADRHEGAATQPSNRPLSEREELDPKREPSDEDDDATLLEGPINREDASSSGPTTSSRGFDVTTTGASRTGGLTHLDTKSAGATAALLGTTAAASPEEALLLEEVRRTRAFAKVALPVAALVLASLPLFAGDPTAKRFVVVAMLAVAASALSVWYLSRDEQAYRPWKVVPFAFVCVLGAYAAIYYFGLFSPAVVAVPFGLYFFCVGQSSRATLAVYLTASLLYIGLAGGIVAGLLKDRGLIRADGLALSENIAVIGLVVAVFTATYGVARASRKGLVTAISQHHKDVRALAQREALLREAREELERALEAGGLGRFSDQTLGSYRLGRVLGRGGMGEVYEATNVASGAAAAVKMLHAPGLSSPAPVLRFLREARIASALNVQNVVRVLEVGGTESPVPYIAMERLHGQDLSELLRAKRRLGMSRVLQLVRDVGAGLAAAQAQGIVHRDLKPRNLFLAHRDKGRPIWKILDFGVSKLVDGQSTLTKNHLVGTPTYMAPEQASGEDVDHRADLYALGVICYRCLVGRPAFSGEAIPEVLYKVLHTMPPAPSLQTRVHSDVDLALALAMAKDPRDRFDSAEELASALETAARGELRPELRARAERLLERMPWGHR